MMDLSPAAELGSQTAVVTGSSSGIGRIIGLELARAGAAVLIHARQNGQAAESVAEEARAIGAEAKVALIDLTDSTGHEALVEQAWDWHGGVHIWVNNAGADVLTGHQAGWSFEEKLEALWRIERGGDRAACRGWQAGE